MTHRDRKLDALKGLLIALVVLGHYLEPTGGGEAGDLYPGWYAEPQRWILLAIYTFHMPGFVLLAGVTSSTRRLGSRVVQLLTLYAVFQVIYSVPPILAGADVGVGTVLVPAYGLWFLLAMVWWLLSLPLVDRAPRLMLVVAVGAALLSVLGPVGGGPLAWARALYFWPFFVAGYLVGRRIVAATRTPSFSLRAAGAAVLAATLAVVIALPYSPEWVRGSRTLAELDVAASDAVGGRALGLLAATLALGGILLLAPATSRWLELLGQRSLAIYLLHIAAIPLLVELCQRQHDALSDSAWTLAAAALTATVLTLLGGVAAFERVVRRVSTLLTERRREPALR